MRIIGLTGKAGSGKSYIAREILARREGYIPLALSAPMKAYLTARGAIPAEESTGQMPKSDRTRRILQIYGTELGRDVYGENVWTAELEWWISWFLMETPFDRFVVPDIRFKNEAQWIYDLGGLVVRVTGRGGLSGPEADHPSEIDLDDVDLPEVDNSSDANTPVLKADLMKIIENHYGQP